LETRVHQRLLETRGQRLLEDWGLLLLGRIVGWCLLLLQTRGGRRLLDD
jgi:hypothetical protein